MICREITERIEQTYPKQVAAPWDNPGLQIGSFEQKIEKVYIALDATDEAIAAAAQAGADLLLTHHPLLMDGIKQINSDNLHGRKILQLLSHGLCHYAMHTNYDVVKMADLAAEKLELTDTGILETTTVLPDGSPGGFGKTGMLPKEMTLHECCEFVKNAFELPGVRAFGDLRKNVQRVAICPGSGKSMIGAALEKHVDAYISGDFGHHDGLDAVEEGLTLIDAGHYGVEHIFIKQMGDELSGWFPELEIVCAPVSHPFHILI